MPASRDDLVAMAKQMSKGDTFGFAIGTVAPGRYRGASRTCSGRTGPNAHTPPISGGRRSPSRRPIEVADFWAGLGGPLKISPPANASCRDAFIAGKLGMWIAGSWNFTGLRDAKVEFTVAPVPRLFKQPVVWTMPHQFTFPKPKSLDRAARRGVDPHPVDDRSRAPSGRSRPGRSRPRGNRTPTRASREIPSSETLLAQAPNWQAGQPTPKWVAAENLTRPVIESVYTAQKPGKAAMEDLARQINALPD